MTMYAVRNKLADVLGLPVDLIHDAMISQLGAYSASRRMTAPQIATAPITAKSSTIYSLSALCRTVQATSNKAPSTPAATGTRQSQTLRPSAKLTPAPRPFWTFKRENGNAERRL